MAKKKKPAGGNAIIYARYSSHNQRDVSIEQQIEACRKHAAELGLTITDTYEDRAISGRTDNRPAFQRMMHDAENGRFSYVLAWKSNRMGRNMMQAMVNESRLMDCGVKVYYAEEDFDDSAAGRFALRSMMNVNQFYSDNLAEDVRRGLMDNANKCMANGRQPLGYKRGEDGKVVVDEPAAAIVREVYARVASGELFTDIARDLNRRGIKTADKGEWNKNSFHRLCSNEKYRGIYIYGDVRIEGGIPSIIDDTLWYKVQEALRVKKLKRNGRHRPGEDDYLLTGKLRCGKCGGYMIGMSGRSKTGDIHYYYACQNRRVGHTCDKKNIRRDIIEPAVAQAIKEYCLTDDAIEWIADKTIEYWEEADRNLQLDSIEGDLAAVQSSISNVMKAIEMGVVTETTRDRLIELEKQRTDLKSKLALAKEEVIHVDRKKLISSLLLFRNGDIHDRQYQEDLFNTFLISVYVYDDDDNGHLKLIFNAFGENNTVDLPINFGETGDVPVFSDREKVRASSPSVNFTAIRQQPDGFFVSPCKTQQSCRIIKENGTSPRAPKENCYGKTFAGLLRLGFCPLHQSRPAELHPEERGPRHRLRDHRHGAAPAGQRDQRRVCHLHGGGHPTAESVRRPAPGGAGPARDASRRDHPPAEKADGAAHRHQPGARARRRSSRD